MFSAPHGGSSGFAARGGGDRPDFAARGDGQHWGGRHHFRHSRRPDVSFGAAPYDYGYYEAPYDMYAAAPDEECYFVRRRVLTPLGYRYRRVYVCD
jgi:hypothetical protein